VIVAGLGRFVFGNGEDEYLRKRTTLEHSAGRLVGIRLKSSCPEPLNLLGYGICRLRISATGAGW